MVHFMGGKQRNKGHKRRADELLKYRQDGFDLVVYILSVW